MLEIRIEGLLAFFVLTFEAVDVIVLHTERLRFPDRFLYFCLMFLVSGVQQSAAYLIYEKIQIHSGSVVSEQLGMFLDEGYDVCYASYGKKQHSGFRNFGSKVNDLMTRVMLGKPKELYVSSYFAAKRFVVDDMLRYEQPYAYVMGLVLRATKNVVNVEVKHRARTEGTSGYTLKRLIALWFNGFTAFSIKPLRIATFIGCLCAGTGFLYGIFTIIKKIVLELFFQYEVQAGFSALMSVLVFIGGMIMLMLGLIGEYVGRIYICMNNSPQYVIREIVNSKK